MDVRHLPLEYPATYKSIRHKVIESLLPGLKRVAGPALQALQSEPAKASRTRQLTNLLYSQRYTLADLAFGSLAPGQQQMDHEPARPPNSRQTPGAPNRNDDTADTQWELVTWLLQGLLVRDFSQTKTVKPGQAQPVPHYLYRLAQQLAGSHTGWQTAHAAKCLQAVLFELSAEHTREKLQAHYGMTVGDDDSITHITTRLRPVDKHNNNALKLLVNRASLCRPVELVVDAAPYTREEFRIRQALQRWRLPVHWLVNWLTRQPQIGQALAQIATGAAQATPGHKAAAEHLAQAQDPSDDADAGSTASALAAVAPARLEQVLQQVEDLHHLGGAATAHVDLDELLDRLETQSQTDAAGAAAAPRSGLADVLDVLDVLDDLRHRFVRVAVMLRLLKREAHKATRTKLGDDLVQAWAEPGEDGQSLFDCLGVKPGIKGLTDAALASASKLGLDAFRQQVDQAVAQINAAHADASVAQDRN